MSNSIPKELIDYLIEIGYSEDFDNLCELGDRFPEARNGVFMRLAPDAWYCVADGITQEEIVCLIKSITRLEAYNNFGSGSVSPVIWLFRRLKKDVGNAELIDWVLQNTESNYLPFGSSNHGAKSYDDYKRRCEKLTRQKMDRKHSEQKRQEDAEARKVVESSQKLFGALKRKDRKAVAALLNRGVDLQTRDKDGQTVLQYAISIGLGEWLKDVD